MTCCFTGHRRFSWEENSAKQKALLAELERKIDLALTKGATHFICGNAVGVDTWAAQIILKKKEENSKIFLEIAVPFKGHNAAVRACQDVQRKADFVHVVSDEKDMRQAYFKRNRYMVDNSDMLIAVYDESRRKCGTAQTIRYAEKMGLEIFRVPV